MLSILPAKVFQLDLQEDEESPRQEPIILVNRDVETVIDWDGLLPVSRGP